MSVGSVLRFRRHALSGKLVLLFISMALVFVLLVGFSLKHVFRSHFEGNVRPHLVQYLEYVQRDIGRPPDPERAAELARKLNIEITIIDERGVWSSHDREIELDELEIEHRYVENDIEYFRVEAEDDRDYLMMRLDDTTLLFYVPNVRQKQRGLRPFVPIVVLLLILLFLYIATRRLVSPIATIQAGVKRFGEGELDHRIKMDRNDEFGDLSNSINTMADDIQRMLDAKRQLLLAISHELRSPLTRAKLSTELLEDENRKRELHQELDEMEKLIEELMETERLSTRHRALNKAEHDVSQLVREVNHEYFKDNAIQMALPEQPLHLSVDGPRLKLLIKNLLDNALRYTPQGAKPPSIGITMTEQDVLLTVQDVGPGIEAHHLPHLTEPFYRIDPSRQRDTGGYGLGLYLCRMIAEAHGGSLQIHSEMGKGTRVKLVLPLTDSAAK